MPFGHIGKQVFFVSRDRRR